jgi:DNA-binding LytR/AlgR family response regulator
MPFKDGYTVLEEIISEETTKFIPFIFLTAKVEKDDFRKGMQLGADDYIFKPFDRIDLLNSIRIRLEKSNFRMQNKVDGSNGNENPQKNRVYDIDKKLLVNVGNKMKLYPVKKIKVITTSNPYIKLKFSDGQFSLQRQTMNDLEEKLPSNYFLRIHRSTIVNTEYITKIDKADNHSFIIKIHDEKEPFHSSKRYSAKLREKLSKM